MLRICTEKAKPFVVRTSLMMTSRYSGFRGPASEPSSSTSPFEASSSYVLQIYEIISVISLGLNDFTSSPTFRFACFASACCVIMRIFLIFQKTDHRPLYHTIVAPKANLQPKTNVLLPDLLLLKSKLHFLSY